MTSEYFEIYIHGYATPERKIRLIKALRSICALRPEGYHFKPGVPHTSIPLKEAKGAAEALLDYGMVLTIPAISRMNVGEVARISDEYGLHVNYGGSAGFDYWQAHFPETKRHYL